MKKILTIVFLLLLFLITSCSLKYIDIPGDYQTLLPGKVEMKVPNISQMDDYSCATASLSMVMSYYDNKLYNNFEVWKKSGSSIHDVKNVCGNDMDGLKRAAKAYGFEKYEFVSPLSLDELKYLLSQDIPVVVNIRVSISPRRYHAVVVTGYDDKNIYINDPSGLNYKLYTEEFLEKWVAHLCTPRRDTFVKSAFLLYRK